MITRYLCVCAVMWWSTIWAFDSDINISLNHGKIIGKYSQTLKGKTFRSFTGIPYAEPPLGELRFKPPVPAKKWKGVLDATNAHNVCPQINVYLEDYNVVGDEDCLYLNVYAPNKSADAPLPVMFYIHGGGWMCGSANSYMYGPELLLDEDIVLVVANYRLGAFGFMSTGDSVLPGNNGLKDQNLALKWVKDNVRYFGGDPDRITVFGQSAGGVSAHFHTLSPLSRDLISGAILQSGNVFTVWSYTTKPIENAKKLASFLDCPTDTSAEIVECLKTIDSHEIVKQDVKFLEYSYDPMIPYKPVIEPNLEGAFITEEPEKIIKSKKGAKVPIMTGFTTEDGGLKVAGLYKNKSLLEILNNDFNRVAPLLFLYNQVDYDTTSISEKIRKFYFSNREIDDSLKYDMINMFTDLWFYVGTDSTIQMHTKYDDHPVYYYLFGYRGSASLIPLFKDVTDDYDYGACHCDELPYLFTQSLFPLPEMEYKDKRLMDVMVALWTNFAKYGNPTPNNNELLPVKWNPVTTQNHEHYLIDKNGITQMGQNWEWDRLKFARKVKYDLGPGQIRDEL